MSIQSTNNIKVWFTSYFKNALKNHADLKNAKINLEEYIKYLRRHARFEKKLIKDIIGQCKELFYNQLRVVTELYYIIELYIEIILNQKMTEAEKASYLRLTKVIYKKSHELQGELMVSSYNSKTFEQNEIYKTTFRQLIATQKIVSKYILKHELYYRPKRNIKEVNYKV
jgi:hypothetical protein